MNNSERERWKNAQVNLVGGGEMKKLRLFQFQGGQGRKDPLMAAPNANYIN